MDRISKSNPARMVSSRGLRRMRGSSSLSTTARRPQEMEPSLATAPLVQSLGQARETYDAPDSPTLPQQLPEREIAGASDPEGRALRKLRGQHHRGTLVVDGVLQIPDKASSLNQRLSKTRSNYLAGPRKVVRNSKPLKSNIGPFSRLSPRFFNFFNSLISHPKHPVIPRPVISDPADPRHLMGYSPCTLPGIEKGIPREETSEVSQFVEAHLPEQAAANRSCLAKPGENFPLASHPIPVIVTSEPEPEHVPTPPSPVTSSSSNTHSSSPKYLTVGHSWERIATNNHRENCRLKLRLKEAEFALLQIQKRNEYLERTCAELEESFMSERDIASQQRLFADAWRRLFETELAKVEVQGRLQQPQSQRTQENRTRAVSPQVEIVAELSGSGPETAPDELSGEEPTILTTLAANPKANNDADELFLSTTPSQIPRISAPRPQDKILSRAGPLELWATPFHQPLLRIPEEEQPRPEFPISDGEEIPYELSELADLRSNFSDVFTGAERQQDGTNNTSFPIAHIECVEESGNTPFQATELEDEEACHDGYSLGGECEIPARSKVAIYRFGSPRIQAVPAVFRVAFESQFESNLRSAAVLRMDSWEWCSVPLLELVDFEFGFWGEENGELSIN